MLLRTPLIHIAYAHAQFETIHPFLDGNGRTGRLLITFLLLQKGLLENPVLFLSSFFKKHKQLYYDRLNAYHNGDILAWVGLFLTGIIQTAEDGIEVAKKIREIRDKDMEKIQMLGKRESESSLKVLRYLFTNPVITTKNIMEAVGFTRSGAQKLIDRLIKLDILQVYKEEKNYARNYIYYRYFKAFVD